MSVLITFNLPPKTTYNVKDQSKSSTQNRMVVKILSNLKPRFFFQK